MKFYKVVYEMAVAADDPKEAVEHVKELIEDNTDEAAQITQLCDDAQFQTAQEIVEMVCNIKGNTVKDGVEMLKRWWELKHCHLTDEEAEQLYFNCEANLEHPWKASPRE